MREETHCTVRRVIDDSHVVTLYITNSTSPNRHDTHWSMASHCPRHHHFHRAWGKWCPGLVQRQQQALDEEKPIIARVDAAWKPQGKFSDQVSKEIRGQGWLRNYPRWEVRHKLLSLPIEKLGCCCMSLDTSLSRSHLLFGDQVSVQFLSYSLNRINGTPMCLPCTRGPGHGCSQTQLEPILFLRITSTDIDKSAG